LLSGPRRAVYLSLGFGFTGIGLLGAILPVLPTTPFLLLASFFFARSSPRLRDWLERSPLFGPFLQDWHRYHGVRLSVKLTAIAVLVLAVAASIAFGNLSEGVVLLLLALAVIGLMVVLRLPLVREAPAGPPQAREAAP